ncbi:Gar1/Naf1 RNA binding region-domain-containing protein [Tirmania nivea]|nr:Gar1/Naf1 RNA binding region-domain-containing protein [Tirmania nivea]
MFEKPVKGEETEGPRGKAAYDPDFLAAAEANKGNEGAEWQYDSSDAESSEGEENSDSEDSDSDEDSGDGSGSDAEDAEFPRLSLAEQAKILMADAGEDGEQSSSKGEVLRTKNEQPEDAIEIKKPDVVLTKADPLEELGEVQSVVERLALIKAKTSGEHQVLNEGSVVALQDRTVIGTIADLLGRVQSPLYTVRFATKEEISENGITPGMKIFYSPKHSTFVFTKALKAQKGSDASNLWDEEVDEHEIEFSDDEAEAEYKRKLKEKKASGKGGKAPYEHEAQGSGRTGPGAPSSDEPYTPLARPPNLSELMKEMAHMTQPVEKNSNRGDHGGKNRGSARKADRGGNRGGKDERRSGGRDKGKRNNERRGNRDRDKGLPDQTGTASVPQSYYGSDSHSSHGYQQPPSAPNYQQPQQAYQQTQSMPQYGYHYGGYTSQLHHQLPQQPQQPLQALHQQLPFQYQTQPAIQAQPSFQLQNAGQSQMFASSPPMPKLPQGAHVNPAFFSRQAQSAQQQAAYFNPQMMWNQQQQQQQQLQYQQNSPPLAQGQFSWPPPPIPPQQADAVMKAVQDQLDILKGIRK